MATKAEQETTVTFNRADEQVRIWTAYPPHVRKLRGDNRATEIDGSPAEQVEDIWGEFVLPWTAFDPLIGFKRRMTEEQRQAAAERMRAFHATEKP